MFMPGEMGRLTRKQIPVGKVSVLAGAHPWQMTALSRKGLQGSIIQARIVNWTVTGRAVSRDTSGMNRSSDRAREPPLGQAGDCPVGEGKEFHAISQPVISS
jgi:hypothetical protein